MDFDLAYEELEFNKVEEKIGVIFDDKKLLVKAFVHPSVCSEPNMNYQRLEFLGDAILQLVVSDYMYRFQTEKTEGDMSKERALLVSKNSLALIIKEEELHHFLMLGKSILTDTKNASKFTTS